MQKLKSSNYKEYSKFIENLARKLTKFYYLKLNKPFKVSNKLRGRGYDPVTSADKAFENFIRKEIKKRFPDHQLIGEEFGHKKSKSDYSWVIDPIDGTRSFVIGNPTWSNLISLNYKGNPILGDKSYGKTKKKFKKIDLALEKKINSFNRQALHAKSLGFIHPKTKKEVFFEATRPDDFETLIKKLKKASI